MLNEREFCKTSEIIRDTVNGTAQSFLFIGKNTDGIDFKRIAGMHWSGVISAAGDILNEFDLPPDKKAERVTDIDASAPNRKKRPFYDLDFLANNALQDPDDEDERKERYNEILTDILKFLSCDNCMRFLYVIGYMPCNEIGIVKFKRMKNRTSFFGIREDELDEKSKEQISNFRYYEEKLEDFLPDDTTDDEDFEETDVNDVSFYVNEKLRSISCDDLKKTEYFLTLANRTAVEQNLPYSKELQKRYFKRFLGAAPDSEPQWYAYSRIGFAVKRSFEKYLFNIVEKALSDTEKMPDGKKYDPRQPIILKGPPSSSKTVVLGALASHIYKKEINPIIFVYRNMLTSNEKDANKEALNDLMEKISKTDTNCRILLICDFSSHINSFDNARELSNYLYNLGRRFVLVMSSFEHPENNGTDPVDYSWNDNKKCFERISGNGTNQKKVLTGTSGFWIVPSSREVTDGEAASIKKIFKDYGGLDINKEDWDRFRESSSDIFEYFFRLTDIVRNSMVNGLDLEKKNLTNYHHTEMKRIYDLNIHKNTGAFVRKKFNEETKKFETVLVSPDDIKKHLGKNDEKDSNDEKDANNGQADKYLAALQDFQDCVAVFGQYAIKTPISLATAFFANEGHNSFYSTEKSVRELNNFLMYSIPWIRCTETDDGNYEFSFRNTEEAIIHVQNTFLTSTDSYKKYFDFILRLFRMYRAMNHIDKDIVMVLTELLKQIGPNSSDWNGFRNTGFKEYFQKNMKSVIDVLDEIVVPNDGRFVKRLDYCYSLALSMITLSREYYGYKQPDLEKLKKIINFCDKITDKMKNSPYGYNPKQMNMIQNEKALCEICYSKEKKDFYSSFESLFASIEAIIFQEPKNGYYYHTILDLFKKWSPSDQNQKLPYCGRLTALIEQSKLYEVQNRGRDGRDDLGKQISEFYQYVNKTGTIKIDDLDNSGDFKKRFDDALKEGDPSYIWLICYNELSACKLMGNDIIDLQGKKLDTNRNMLCKKVYEFMREYYDDAVGHDLTTLRLMLRVYWLYTAYEEPQTANTLENECRLTKFKKEQWEVIHGICYDYQKLCKEKETAGAPFMRYMYALSALHTNGISRENLVKCKSYLGERTESRYIEKNEQRMFSQFVICDENGDPVEFSGYIKDIENEKKGTMAVKIKNNEEFFCDAYYSNIGLSSMKELGKNNSRGTAKNFKRLVLGAGYTKIQVYDYDVIENKENKRRNRNG